MTKSKILAATVAAVTLTGALLGTSAPALAWHPHHHHHHGFGLGVGIALGTIAAAAAASEPVYDCYYQKRYNRWGHRYYVKVCERD